MTSFTKEKQIHRHKKKKQLYGYEKGKGRRGKLGVWG